MKRCQNNSSQVRVCVRARPITAKEQENGSSNILEVSNSNEIQLSGRLFTFDSVFDDSTSQSDLYQNVAPSLMQSFLDGYNATIIAYGQTGSGKTYTMGSEAHIELEVMPNTGLIPRFLKDLFEQLTSREYQMEASFLEVYGDDIHDLLDLSRTVLPLREDTGGGIVCTGLTTRNVRCAADAIQILHEGTLNRSTAATLMNATSSRSHAIFTVKLQLQNVTSKLTFVDLAGSERMKKTGAEGERAREGIQINMGLLALGNVINALADDERIQRGGKKTHVPYRQSKLTRLLQEALGGNSQTVFLACVSSTDENMNETLSTLQYAYRARNIQNSPTRNVDNSGEQDVQLKAYISVLETELIGQKFDIVEREKSPTGRIMNEAMKRTDVIEYLSKLRIIAHDMSRVSESSSIGVEQEPTPFTSTANIRHDEYPTQSSHDINQSVMENVDTAFLAEINPDEDIAILDQLLELQQQDHDFDHEQKKDDEELKQVEGELVEKEQLLLHLRESLKVYHNMKAKYESLVVEVQNLEREKIELAEQLEKASSNPTLGCSRTIKKEIEAVERNLVRARNETQKHRLMYLKAEQEAQKCRTLEQKIKELKDGRANLIKKQREAAHRHRDMIESRTKEIWALKRKDRNAVRKMSKLETELSIHKRNLENRQAYCKKLIEQKKQTEAHLMKLLAMRKQNLRERDNQTLHPAKHSLKLTQGNAIAPMTEEIKAICLSLETAVTEFVSSYELECQYKKRFEIYSDLMRSMVSAVKDVDDLDKEKQDKSMHAIQELDLEIELAAAELKKVQDQMSYTITDRDHFIESSARCALYQEPAPILRAVIAVLMKRLVDVEIRAREHVTSLQLKDDILKSFDAEVEELNNNIAELKKELLIRHDNLRDDESTQYQKIEGLKQENASLQLAWEQSQQENSLLTLFSTDLNQDYEIVLLELNETKEKLAVAKASSSDRNRIPSQNILDKIHMLWREIGLATTDREKYCYDIEHSLEITCENFLEKAQALKESTMVELSTIQNEISQMTSTLKLDPIEFNSTSKSLLQQLEELRMVKSELRPLLECAINRRRSIANKALELSGTLGIPKESLDKNLAALIDVEASGTDITTILDEDIEDFLHHCDEAIARLQIQKCKILASNEKLREESHTIVMQMNIKVDELMALVDQNVSRTFPSLPSWWDNQLMQMAVRSVSIFGELLQSTRPFSLHLEVVHKTLTLIAETRRRLSTEVRSIIERAQITLLKTVDSEFDANSEYSNFHDELFRLPPLSKDFFHSCFAEIEALCIGVDVMSQSEIETLTVVSEALGISSSNRGVFWDDFDRSIRESRSNDTIPFDKLITLAIRDDEEWLGAVLKNGIKSYMELDSRLLKLEKIHAEVELLRNRQDTKSRIISLDTEVRILSLQLKDFEDKKCNKQRLTTKKTTSSSLLQEERFRKQMQSKFTSKVSQLLSMLETWKVNEKSQIDYDILSEEVRSILKKSGRSEFMHLRTVEYNRASKRTADVLPQFDVLSSPHPKRFKKTNSEITAPNVALKTLSVPHDANVKRKQIFAPIHGKDQNTANRNVHDSNALANKDSAKCLRTKKKIVLDPFGNVLALAASPHQETSKEN